MKQWGVLPYVGVEESKDRSSVLISASVTVRLQFNLSSNCLSARAMDLKDK
jgi:hypothetical protein